MKRILAFFCLIPALFACSQPKEDLVDRALTLCNYIPDHELNPEAKDYMTAEFFGALSEAFDAPVADYGEIGENEWLYYFVTGNGGSAPYYSVKSVTKQDDTHAVADITVQDTWEEGGEPDPEKREYQIKMLKVGDKWLLDDFDGKKDECVEYVKELRAQYAAGNIIEALESDDYTREFVPDFQKRVEEFYAKYGE